MWNVKCYNFIQDYMLPAVMCMTCLVNVINSIACFMKIIMRNNTDISL